MTQQKILSLIQLTTILAVALCLFGGLSACGKKSALTPPEDSQYPKQYPRQ